MELKSLFNSPYNNTSLNYQSFSTGKNTGKKFDVY